MEINVLLRLQALQEEIAHMVDGLEGVTYKVGRRGAGSFYVTGATSWVAFTPGDQETALELVRRWHTRPAPQPTP